MSDPDAQDTLPLHLFPPYPPSDFLERAAEVERIASTAFASLRAVRDATST